MAAAATTAARHANAEGLFPTRVQGTADATTVATASPGRSCCT
jgi:hypothetical protein